jgi:hypothetical protein
MSGTIPMIAEQTAPSAAIIAPMIAAKMALFLLSESRFHIRASLMACKEIGSDFPR